MEQSTGAAKETELKPDQPNDQRTRLLRALRRRRFARHRFVGQDALVARLPLEGSLPPAIQALIDDRPSARIYPVEGGYLYKWRHHGAGTPPGEGFTVEPKGWDHEHCDGCDRTIDVGATAWLTERAPYFSLCPYCYRRLRQLRGEFRPPGIETPGL